MNQLEQAIEAHREAIATMQRELEALEVALAITSRGNAQPVKQRQSREQKAAAVDQVEPKPKLTRGKSTPTHFACGHGREGNTLNFATGSKCRVCKAASQKRYNQRKKLWTGNVIAEVTVPAPPTLVPAPNAVAIANASKWQKQCPILDYESGRRCSLLAPHSLPHSASGRTFTTGLNPSELGGTSRPSREFDVRAVSGGGGMRNPRDIELELHAEEA